MGRTWAPVGKTPTVEYNFNWKRLAAMGGITLEGRIYFRVHNGTIKQEQVMDYLVQLLIKTHKKSAHCPRVGWIPNSQGEGGP
ncbi:MAG: transposase [Nitrososphaerota archaeon]|nr:transposase [Nitrososphaerota archaeon]